MSKVVAALDETVLVSEAGLRRGIRGLVAHEQVIAEGAGIAAVAALLEGRIEIGGARVAALVSGANIDLERLTGILTEA